MLDDSHACGPGCKMMGFMEISPSSDWSRENEIMLSWKRHAAFEIAVKQRLFAEEPESLRI
ncbi:hypothetical protein, partial [Sinorhizobium medicae]